MTIRWLQLFYFFSVAVYAQTPPPHPFWSNDAVQEIRLTFAQADWYEQLTANYQGTEEESIYLTASFQWGSVKFDSIGVRFKGNSSYRVNSRKKPFRLKLNEFVKGQKIGGIAAYNLSNGFNDPSMVREAIYYEMAAQLGLKAPRTSFAALYINDEYWGLYVLGEVVNSDFLKNYYGKGEDEGNLYKGNIGATFAYLGTDIASYKSVWEKQTNEEADDWTDLIALCRTLNETPASQLESVMDELMDIDSFLTAMALDNATVNLDNYIGMSQNFNIYKRPSDGKWVWIVWDPSLAFGAFSQRTSNPAEYPLQFSISAGGGGGQGGTARPLFTRLIAVPSIQTRYLQIYKQLVEQVFNPTKIVARMIALRDLIRPYVVSDTQKLMTLAQFDSAMTSVSAGGTGGPGGGGGSAPGLQTFVDARVAWLTGQLATAATAGLLISDTSGLQFTANAGTNPSAQTVTLNYTGVGTGPSYSVRSATANGGTWLAPLPTGGPLPGSFQVSVSASGLAVGSYTGSVSVFLAGAGNSPIVIPVMLTVQPAEANSKPTISAVTNAASYATGPVSPGEILVLFGTGLGPAALISGNGGAQVTFDGVAAHVIYSRSNQASVVVPMEVAAGSTAIQVIYGGQSSSAASAVVQAATPGIFTIDGSGTGQGAVLNQDTAINSIANPAAKGSIISIFLTGAGMVNSTNHLTGDVAVEIGGQPAVIQYAGVAPGAVAGLYQINATIPASISSGAIPVIVSVGGVSSQAGVTVAVQ
ncbi:MAG: hypothetical protein IANPNBLG_00554 [Bryobacteraceae bacterium]|nr:hypothetical protein [Bryobacteraceae bacterium]